MHEAADKDGGPIKKPTKFMTNSAGIAKALSNRCGGKLGWCSRLSGGRHALQREPGESGSELSLCFVSGYSHRISRSDGA